MKEDKAEIDNRQESVSRETGGEIYMADIGSEVTDVTETVVKESDEIYLEGGIKTGVAKTRAEYDQEAGSVSLFDYVTETFEKRGAKDPTAWSKLMHIEKERLDEIPMSQQRLVINRSLRLKLGEYPIDTRDQRYCLIDQGSVEDWKGLVEPVISDIVKLDQTIEEIKETPLENSPEK